VTLGFPTDKGSIDSWVPTVVVELRTAMDQVLRIKAWLDTQQTTDLTALGYSSAEASLLIAAVTDLSNLVATGRGQRAQASASNFFFNADKLTGLR